MKPVPFCHQILCNLKQKSHQKDPQKTKNKPIPPNTGISEEKS